MNEQNFYIDKLTNSIEDAVTGKSHETEVVRVIPDDLKVILRKNGWLFDWKTEFNQKDRELYKLIVRENKVIQGLISIQPLENYFEMHLIESAPHNYGRSKKYIGVPGNLVAFACKKSLDSGFGGFVGSGLKHGSFSTISIH